MRETTKQPRRARMGLIGLVAVAAAALVAPSAASAQYPPRPSVSVTCNNVAPDFQYQVTTDIASTATITLTQGSTVVGPKVGQPLTGSITPPSTGTWDLKATVSSGTAEYSAYAVCTTAVGSGGATTPPAATPQAAVAQSGGSLPSTGAGTTQMLWIAGITLLAGLGVTSLMSLSRRRGDHAAS